MNLYPSECEDENCNVPTSFSKKAPVQFYPTHLACPYCPAQAFSLGIVRWLRTVGDVMGFECPAHHKFYVPPEQKEEPDVEGQNGKCVW